MDGHIQTAQLLAEVRAKDAEVCNFVLQCRCSQSLTKMVMQTARLMAEVEAKKLETQTRAKHADALVEKECRAEENRTVELRIQLQQLQKRPRSDSVGGPGAEPRNMRPRARVAQVADRDGGRPYVLVDGAMSRDMVQYLQSYLIFAVLFAVFPVNGKLDREPAMDGRACRRAPGFTQMCVNKKKVPCISAICGALVRVLGDLHYGGRVNPNTVGHIKVAELERAGITIPILLNALERDVAFPEAVEELRHLQ